MLKRCFGARRSACALARTRGTWPTGALARELLWLLLVGAASGCPRNELAPLEPCTVSAVNERVDQSGVADVDLLFMIDNSGSMATEQAKLAAQLPRLVGVLTSGDRFFGVPDDAIPPDTTQKERYFTQVKSLHLGVVSSNLGGIDDFPARFQKSQAILSCAHEGDEGKLQHDPSLALTEVTEPTGGALAEFPGYDKDEVVVAPDDDCQGLADQPPYQEYSADSGTMPSDLAQRFGCVARLGVQGCPFEQQLESTWRALAPSGRDGEQYRFLNGTKGQGDAYNSGFVRDEAILAIMLVTDEDDCSITDAGKAMFDLTGDTTDINMRCGRNETNSKFLWPADRYVNGFKALKPDYPDRIIFGAITGIPLDTEGKTPDEILAMPDMEFRQKLGTDLNPLPEPSCTSQDLTNPDNPKTSEAYPARRILRVAAGFEDQAVVYSICNDDFAPALDTLIAKIAVKLRGNCLPRKLTRSDGGKVNCEVSELLPQDADSACSPERGHIGRPYKREVPERKNGRSVITIRRACKMSQVPVVEHDGQWQPEQGERGWYYDDFSADLGEQCENDPQRISFQFGGQFGSGLPPGAGAVIDCFQPVARIETADVQGMDAVNTRCSDDDSVCSQHSDDDYTLICVDHQTCQIQCKDTPDCPPGWACADGLGAGASVRYCQLATCPQDESGANDSPATSGS
ncbi:MAG TPA: hypothetical protein VG963_29050 [Polyangiaceae bacterium]|nr:hypothetical protein [Polyangiaceae bacterium]